MIQIYSFRYFILIISLITLVIIFCIISYLIIKNQKPRFYKGYSFHRNTIVEVLLAIISCFIVASIIFVIIKTLIIK